MATRKEVLEALEAGDPEGALRLFRELPDDARAPGEGELSLTLQALYRRYAELAAELARGEREVPGLLEASALGWEAEAKAALGREPEAVHLRSADGFTPLHYAAYFGRGGLVALLLDHAADPDVRAHNPSGVRPLHSAAAAGDAEAVRHLLEAGAEPDPVQAGGFTPLMAAALHGRRDLVLLLLAAGADPSRRADDGRSAVEMAREEGHEELAERLARGVSPGAETGEGIQG